MNFFLSRSHLVQRRNEMYGHELKLMAIFGWLHAKISKIELKLRETEREGDGKSTRAFKITGVYT